jgi:hypothetical protein
MKKSDLHEKDFAKLVSTQLGAAEKITAWISEILRLYI